MYNPKIPVLLGAKSEFAECHIKKSGGRSLLSKTVTRKERRVGTSQMVGNLLAERQEMLVAYCRLAGLEPYSPDKPVKRLLEEFCQLLVDYTAFGHFELYGRLSEGGERRDRVAKTADEVYSRIADISEQTVVFNDKYDASDHTLSLQSLPEDLSSLGECLALRMELEDRLIGSLVYGIRDEV